ncbi:serine/threonine-protein phosphatase CPPED1-like isoform X3 [Parasteatoda tepidariorum]
MQSQLITDQGLLRKASGRIFPGFQKDNEGEWKGPFCFIQGADTQLGMIENFRKQPGWGWEEDLQLTKSAIAAVNALIPRPRFFIVCGDMVHHTQGEEHRHEQEQDFIQLFKELSPDIPLVCVCGNHDVGNTPTPQTIAGFRQTFGDDYFTFVCGGVMFIVLNSQYFYDPSLVLGLAEEHNSWLDKQLEEAKTGKYKHVVIFQHIPWFLDTPEEKKCHYNLHPELRRKWLPKFLESNVKAIFCGHFHGNAGGFYEELEIVVTSAIGVQMRKDKSGFRIVVVDEDSIKHKYYALDEVPQTISLQPKNSELCLK